jgi:hypothetical protein
VREPIVIVDPTPDPDPIDVDAETAKQKADGIIATLQELAVFDSTVVENVLGATFLHYEEFINTAYSLYAIVYDDTWQPMPATSNDSAYYAHIRILETYGEQTVDYSATVTVYDGTDVLYETVAEHLASIEVAP